MASSDDDKSALRFCNRRKKRTSKAWEYFDIVDDDKKIATCNQCQTLFSFKSTVSNLLKHLRRKHSVDIRAYSDEEDEAEATDKTNYELDTESTTQSPKRYRSMIWRYFKCVDFKNKLAMCRICKSTITHSTTNSNMKRHLLNVHPELNLNETDVNSRIILSTSDGLFELVTTPKADKHDNQGADDIEEVYLEDLDENLDSVRNSSTERTHPSKRKAFNTSAPKRPTLRDKFNSSSDSSDEELTFRKRYVKKRNDTVDYFGKYIVSLLKQLPKELSNQLQTDFIKQIMNAQLTYDTQRAMAQSKNNGYSITIVQEPKQEISIESEPFVPTVPKSNDKKSTDCESNSAQFF